MSTEQRPEWASGDEWNGWGFKNENMHRAKCAYHFYISQTHMTIERAFAGAVTLQFSTPDAARRVADKIAEELGGWA